MSNTFFFTLSGENIDLAKYEIISIFKLKKVKFKLIKQIDRLLIISSKKNISKYIASRVALTHDISKLLMQCPLEEKKIIKALKIIDFNKIITNKKSFAVRIQKIGHNSLNSEYFERMIGKIIHDLIKERIKVNLKSPEILFYGIFIKNKFYFGINEAQRIRSKFKLKTLNSRPFFHPSALKPRLARTMINLSQTKEGEIFLDPFCGSGSILIEAYLIGCSEIIGIDINRKMINGAKRNLDNLGVKKMALLLSDSNNIPLRRINSIATDPPYGRSSSTHKKPLIDLLENFFIDVSDLILKNRLITLALPSDIKLSNLIDNLTFKIKNEFKQYVHSSLTRKIYIIQKNKK